MAKFIKVTAKYPNEDGKGLRINIDHILRYEDYGNSTKIHQIQPAGDVVVLESVEDIDKAIENA